MQMFERIKRADVIPISFLYFSRNFTLLFLILFSLLLMPFESRVELRCIYIYIWDQNHPWLIKLAALTLVFSLVLLIH